MCRLVFVLIWLAVDAFDELALFNRRKSNDESEPKQLQASRQSDDAKCKRHRDGKQLFTCKPEQSTHGQFLFRYFLFVIHHAIASNCSDVKNMASR